MDTFSCQSSNRQLCRMIVVDKSSLRINFHFISGFVSSEWLICCDWNQKNFVPAAVVVAGFVCAEESERHKNFAYFIYNLTCGSSQCDRISYGTRARECVTTRNSQSQSHTLLLIFELFNNCLSKYTCHNIMTYVRMCRKATFGNFIFSLHNFSLSTHCASSSSFFSPAHSYIMRIIGWLFGRGKKRAK